MSASSAKSVLQKRAHALAAIRHYFAERDILEVETPLLGQYPVSDPQLDNLRVENPFANKNSWQYLQTSPEYAMKQLLAMGSGSIYQLCKAFRKDQPGRLHAVEFTLLEWYRQGFTLAELIDDVACLVKELTARNWPQQVISYRDAFLQYVGIDPFAVNIDELRGVAREKIDVSFDDDDMDVWLDLLLTHLIEPQLGWDGLTFLTDYPPSQAALSRLKSDSCGNLVAERFELYMQGVEIANGYHELNDADEQLQRFEVDNKKRIAIGKPAVEIDKTLIAAMREPGIPDCSGVALGVDRLMLFVD